MRCSSSSFMFLLLLMALHTQAHTSHPNIMDQVLQWAHHSFNSLPQVTHFWPREVLSLWISLRISSKILLQPSSIWNNSLANRSIDSKLESSTRFVFFKEKMFSDFVGSVWIVESRWDQKSWYARLRHKLNLKPQPFVWWFHLCLPRSPFVSLKQYHRSWVSSVPFTISNVKQGKIVIKTNLFGRGNIYKSWIFQPCLPTGIVKSNHFMIVCELQHACIFQTENQSATAWTH